MKLNPSWKYNSWLIKELFWEKYLRCKIDIIFKNCLHKPRMYSSSSQRSLAFINQKRLALILRYNNLANHWFERIPEHHTSSLLESAKICLIQMLSNFEIIHSYDKFSPSNYCFNCARYEASNNKMVMVKLLWNEYGTKQSWTILRYYPCTGLNVLSYQTNLYQKRHIICFHRSMNSIQIRSHEKFFIYLYSSIAPQTLF